MGNSFWFTVLFVAWMALITYLSLGSLSGTGLSSVAIPHKDKIAHFVFYFGMVLLGCLFIRERTQGRFRRKNSILLMFLLALVYGIVIEVLQVKITVDREGDWYDALANSVGAFAGSIVIGRLFSQNGRLKWEY